MLLDELIRMGYGNVSVLTRATNMLQMCDITVFGSCMLVPAFLTQGIESKTLYESKSNANSTTQDNVGTTIILGIISVVYMVCAACFCVYYYILRKLKTNNSLPPPVSHILSNNNNYYAIHRHTPGRFDYTSQ